MGNFEIKRKEEQAGKIQRNKHFISFHSKQATLKKRQNTLNKVHQFQQVTTRKRPKDSAGTSQESFPGRPLIVVREYSTKTGREGKRNKHLKSQKKCSKYVSQRSVQNELRPVQH